jgi:hypothetical protein
LPVFSVETEEEARMLVVLSCETALNGAYIARELAAEQTFANLEAFSTRLDKNFDIQQRRRQ